MLDGYPLRKYTWKDWFIMFLSSSIILQMLVTFGAASLMNFNATTLEASIDQLTRLTVNGTIYGTLISLPLTLLAVHWRKIPIINRKGLSREVSFILRGLSKKDWAFLVRYIPISYVLYIGGSMLVAWLFGSSEAANQVAVESLFDYVPIWVMFIMIVIVAPIAEELLFRGIILFPGDRLNTTWLRTILSAILFGLVHGPTDIYSLYSYVGMGFIFSYAAKRTQSVEAAIVYHFLNNLLGFLVIVSL